MAFDAGAPNAAQGATTDENDSQAHSLRRCASGLRTLKQLESHLLHCLLDAAFNAGLSTNHKGDGPDALASHLERRVSLGEFLGDCQIENLPQVPRGSAAH